MNKITVFTAKNLLLTSVFTGVAGLALLSDVDRMIIPAILLILLTLILAMLAVSRSSKEKSSGVNSLSVLVVLVTVVGIFFALASNSMGQSRSKARQISCASNLKQIGLALQQYAMDNKDYFPPYDGEKGLKMLFDGEYLSDRKCFTCPEKSHGYSDYKEKFLTDYEYKGGYSVKDNMDLPLCWDKAENHQRFGNTLYIDGHVTGFTGNDWQKNSQMNK